MSKWGLFRLTPIKRGSIEHGTEPTTTYVFRPYWGEHATRNEAKCRWVREMDADLANSQDVPFLVKRFDQQARNEKIYKVMKMPSRCGSQTCLRETQNRLCLTGETQPKGEQSEHEG